MASVDLESREDCLSKFKSNNAFGLLVLAGIVAGRWLLEGAEDDDAEARGEPPREEARPQRQQRVIWLLMPPASPTPDSGSDAKVV